MSILPTQHAWLPQGQYLILWRLLQQPQNNHPELFTNGSYKMSPDVTSLADTLKTTFLPQFQNQMSRNHYKHCYPYFQISE